MGNHGVKKVIEFCYGHRLLDYDGQCRNLHGHNAQLAMVIDFGEIKDIAKGWVNDNLDHKMLLHRDDPIAKVLQDFGKPLYLMDGNPTAGNIAKLIFYPLSKLGLRVSRVSLGETPSGCTTYSED